ncbi:930_t:CDS:1, partial [Acaulospora colombiana]
RRVTGSSASIDTLLDSHLISGDGSRGLLFEESVARAIPAKLVKKVDSQATGS